jgi:hypothetical protein
MHLQTGRRVSPAFVVAMIALFVALGGTAGAVVTAAVPLAKRALVADKAKVATTAKVANVARVANVAKLANTAKTATTAATAIRATTAALADNANALGGSTSAQIIAAATTAGRDAALTQSPAGSRPASTAAGMVLIKTDTTQQILGNDEGSFTVTCELGQRVVSGGYATSGAVLAYDSFPSSGTAWTFYLVNEGATDAAIALHAICLK